jgi:hypothetical protein
MRKRTMSIALGLMPEALRRYHKCPVVPRSCLPSVPRALDALGNRKNWYVYGCVWCGARLTSHVHDTHQANRDSVKKGNNPFANHLSTRQRDSFFLHESSSLVPPHSSSHNEEEKAPPYWAHRERIIVASTQPVRNGSFLRPLGEPRASSSFLYSGPRASVEKRATSAKRSHLVPTPPGSVRECSVAGAEAADYPPVPTPSQREREKVNENVNEHEND